MNSKALSSLNTLHIQTFWKDTLTWLIYIFIWKKYMYERKILSVENTLKLWHFW